MRFRLAEEFLKAVGRRDREPDPAPLLVELFGAPEGPGWRSEPFPFCYRTTSEGPAPYYEVACALTRSAIGSMRKVVRDASEELDP